jgi:hypothetical protein
MEKITNVDDVRRRPECGSTTNAPSRSSFRVEKRHCDTDSSEKYTSIYELPARMVGSQQAFVHNRFKSTHLSLPSAYIVLLFNMQSYTFTLLALLACTSAFSILPRQSSSCPTVWSDVASELQTTFAGCGRDAHGAIRAPFHDCINNGCDGSLVLSDECGRGENAGLSGICGKLKNWSAKYNVSAADMIQFAAATAIAVCPLGPKVKALVGRKDSSDAAPVGSVPSSKDSVDKILAAFSAKGFSAEDVVALMGTHSVAVQVNDDPSQAGKSLDSTPSTYDSTFYKETRAGTAPYSLQSDKLLSNDTQVCAHALFRIVRLLTRAD